MLQLDWNQGCSATTTKDGTKRPDVKTALVHDSDTKVLSGIKGGSPARIRTTKNRPLLLISTLLILISCISGISEKHGHLYSIRTRQVGSRFDGDADATCGQPADHLPAQPDRTPICFRHQCPDEPRSNSLDQLHACFGSREARRRRSEKSRIRRQR